MTSIVVIEDNYAVLKSVLDLLNFEGFSAEGAQRSVDGLKIVQSNPPDVVICDIGMPEMDGYAVLEALRKDSTTRTVPFIFLTARTERTDMRRGMELGADDYVTKPFSRDDLISAVETQLRKRHTIAQKHESTLSALRRNVIYALPHELRTPLTVVLGNAELLVEDYETMPREAIRDMSLAILKHGRRIHHLFENYLAYAQIEMAASDPRQLTALRNHVIKDAAAVIESEATEQAQEANRSADLELVLEGRAAIQISEANLRKVVRELLDNAFKFSEPGSTVTISTLRTPSRFSFAIRDRGRGMTPAEIKNIGAYMQFQRTLYEQQGLGLGLVIAKRLVELHNGTLQLESAPGLGTTVSVQFPL